MGSYGRSCYVCGQTSGHPSEANIATLKLFPLGKGHQIACFDGVVTIGKQNSSTNRLTARLLRISVEGVVQEVLSGFHQIVDPGYNLERTTIAMPVMSDRCLIFLNLDVL